MFFDLVGRTIIGEKTGEDTENLFIKNPVVVNIVEQKMQDPNTGQQISRMALQLLPLFFREFLAAPEEGIEFSYNKKNITPTKGQPIFDFKVAIQYDQITAAPIHRQQQAPAASMPPTQPAQQADRGKAIKLFDE